MSNLQRLRHQPTTPQMSLIYLASNQKIAGSLLTFIPSGGSQGRSRFRPISPVKALSSFLGGLSREQGFSYTKLPNLQNLDLGKAGAPMRLLTHETSMKQPNPPANLAESGKSDQHGIKTTMDTISKSFSQLENTLSTYIVALHSRCGNVVGKVLRNRANADDLAINELYNALREFLSEFGA